MDGLVSESTGSRNDSYTSLLVDVARHDTNLALFSIRCYIDVDKEFTKRPTHLTRSNDSRAVGANQPGLGLPDEPVFHLHHVLLRDTLGDADN